MNVKVKSTLGMSVGMQCLADLNLGAKYSNRYVVECREFAEGPLLWREEISNIVTTQGLNDTLTKYFTGVSYTAAWYVGLINNASFSALVVGDTAAQIGGSNGWVEDTAYSGNRPALTLGSAAAGSISNTASVASFTMNASGTLNGAFIASANTGTTGALYGEASFGATQPYVSGNVITVTATLTQS